MGREEKDWDSLHPLLPLRFPEFCSHADSPEGQSQGCWEGPGEAGSPQGLTDSGNVGLVPSSWESLPGPCVLGLML